MSTKYLAAYALASLKTASPSKDDVTKILKSVGIAVDQATLDFTFEAIGTKSVADLVNAGNAILAKNTSAPSAGAAAPAAASAAPAAKKEEKKVVEEEEDDFGMGGLF